MKLLHFCLACTALSLSGPAFADGTATTSTGYIAAGAGFAPAFEGTDEYEAVPFFFGDLKWNDMDIQMRGLELRLDIIGNDSALSFGPIINYRAKRDSSDGSGRVRDLSDVKAAFEAGGFVSYRFGGDRNGAGRITLDLSGVHDLNDAYDGVLVTGRASYAALRSNPLSVDFDLSTTWGSENYQQTYFGISHDDADRSGLPTYHPDASFRDVTFGATATYQFNRHWGLLARAELTQYVGDSADSPIVHEGSKTVGLMGLLLSYRF